MESAPAEILDLVLENVSSLDDLTSLSLTNKLLARCVANTKAKTLWHIAYSMYLPHCRIHPCDDWDSCSLKSDWYDKQYGTYEDCRCEVAEASVEYPKSTPFKIRAWLYRRGCRRCFGKSEEDLAGCAKTTGYVLEYPYGMEFMGENENFASENQWELFGEAYNISVGEWRKIWLIFKRHMVMQRVQRVNMGDSSVKAEWKAGGRDKIVAG